METVEPIDSHFVDGWDKNGVHCWTMHSFDSLEYVENASEHICLVERKMPSGILKCFEFRKYTNKYGDERFLMFDVDNGMESEFGGKNHLNVHITDSDFFRRFCNGLFDCGEITEEYRDILLDSIEKSELKELDELY